ncbi:alpha-1,3-arabinosyltransferase XAT3-like [Punica granatum]|uniref:Alpha-1,3-arabinosyltransferase XAT3-like n=1 Tax=Punica granatum TaxID=22663 RepID=A0A6P8C2E6_PUNGR|nr:alpha-1,3-arabinosyltransferase XAT3-like [Punica granatum]XP_031375931.1 alpha-1,3-arabinosyltransferase XAT3-like [Punica granatum]
MKKISLTTGASILGLSIALLIFYVYDLSSVNFTRIQVLKRWAIRPRARSRPTVITCNRSDLWYDLCSINGPNLLEPTSSTLFLVDPTRYFGPPVSVRTRPYTRKSDLGAMKHVKELTLTSAQHHMNCAVMHTSPAVVFSAGGYTGNFFHDFNDGLLPLFITVNSFFGNHDFHLVVTDCSLWWPQKYKEVISRISSLPMIDMDRANRTHCFPSTIVGLIKHGPMTVEPARLARPITLRDFGSFLKDAYLGQGEDKAMQQSNHSQDTGSVRPRLVLLSRTRQVGRAVLNQKELMALAEQIGFNVTLFKPSHKTSLADAFRLIHASHAMLGVHGAGLMHSIFLRPGSVLVQVVPIATEWVSEMFFGNPARTLGLEYIEYRIQPSESSLADQFSIDDVVLNNPRAATKGDWSNMKLYLKTQNVKLDMVRFRACLEEAYVKAKRFMEENEGNENMDKLVSSSRKLIK